MILMSTDLGDMKIELHEKEAPISCKNFLDYVESGFYDGTIFHRVIPNFMIQGGGFNENMQEKDTREAIKNEADNGLKNRRGTLAMARTQLVDSATSQFFINLVDNSFLDHGSRDFGYAVFAELVDGLDVLDSIGAVKTGNRLGHSDVPIDSIHIQKVIVI